MPTTLDPKSPECGWDPFTDWLESQGIDPRFCRSVVIADDERSMSAVMFKRDGSGRAYERTGPGTVRPVVYAVTVDISSPPPRRTP